MTVKLALPTGDPRPAVGALLEAAGIAATGYEPSSRLLRSVNEDEGLTLRIFREKDIPVQVAMGNYDLGICGDVWLTELQVRFPEQRVVRIGGVPGPETEVWLAAAASSGLAAGDVPLGASISGAAIASELPNLADLLAVHLRIPGYRLLDVYGSADAYTPEDADLALLPVAGAGDVVAKDMTPLHRLFRGGLALIANADALRSKDLTAVLGRLAPHLTGVEPELELPEGRGGVSLPGRPERRRDIVRLALPDGHAQRHTYANLLDAGLRFEGYEEKSYVRRPVSAIPGLEVKVLRPQDMPALVAMGMFDIAVTGVDWLTEITSRFPSAPVEMAVDLGRSRYKIGPVVDQAFPADDTASALKIWLGLGRPVRIASEFPALAESFARSVHLPHTTIIPIAGASEGFVPEDADILIEGSETGTSIRANNLKMLDPFMESTNCVIVRRDPVTTRQDILDDLIARFRKAAAAVTTA